MSTSTIRDAQARKQAKHEAQLQAQAQATADALVRKEDAAAAAARETKHKPAPKSRKEQAYDDKVRAEKQSVADAARKPPTPEEIDAAYVIKPGEEPPLHVLNARAKMANAANKDEARIIGAAVGKVAFEMAQGRASRGTHSRYAKKRDAEAAMAQVQAQTEKKD